MSDLPLISIAMATYNGEKFLKEQLDSIYQQSYQHIEVIVTDDGSTDNTLVILEEYAHKYGLKYYVNEVNLGFVKNFEKAISLCIGEYIALSDQDDIWESDKLSILFDEIDDKLLIHSDAALIDEKARVLKSHWKEDAGFLVNIEELVFRNVVTGCTVLFRRELLKTALPFPNGVLYHDWWLSVCASMHQSITYSSMPLIQYRQHEDQDTGVSKQLANSLLHIAWKHIVYRFKEIEFGRLQASKKQYANLLALNKTLDQESSIKPLVKDAIEYFDDYIQHQVHWRTFVLGIKYRKILYPRRNYLLLKNILLDIVG